jgi:hypothetical protein
VCVCVCVCVCVFVYVCVERERESHQNSKYLVNSPLRITVEAHCPEKEKTLSSKGLKKFPTIYF